MIANAGIVDALVNDLQEKVRRGGVSSCLSCVVFWMRASLIPRPFIDTLSMCVRLRVCVWCVW
jgi:hypothetical protein